MFNGCFDGHNEDSSYLCILCGNVADAGFHPDYGSLCCECSDRKHEEMLAAGDDGDRAPRWMADAEIEMQADAALFEADLDAEFEQANFECGIRIR